jgi:transcriptional regulator with XRE-family HTH domain
MAAKRVAEIEDELRLAAGLTALRERAGVSQRELAEQMGVSQPRIVAIEKSKNVTIDVLDAFVSALGGRLEVRCCEQVVALDYSVSQPRLVRTLRNSVRLTR